MIIPCSPLEPSHALKAMGTMRSCLNKPHIAAVGGCQSSDHYQSPAAILPVRLRAHLLIIIGLNMNRQAESP